MQRDTSTLSTFIRASAWGSRLAAAELDQVLDSVRLTRVRSGQHITRVGEVAEHWFGIVDGTVIQTVTGFDGKAANLTAACAGTWFGEGTLMKRAPWGYDAISRKEGILALVPAATFHWLMDVSLPFNQFVARLLNRRLSHYMGTLANERLTNTDQRMAHMLASLFDPELYPNRATTLRITQSDLALLAGMSRQRANATLQKLQEEELIQINRTGLTILRVAELRAY